MGQAIGTSFSNLHIKIPFEIAQAALQQYVLAALLDGKITASLEPRNGLSLMAGVLDIQTSWLLLILPAEPASFTVLEVLARTFTAQHGSIAVVSRRDSSTESVLLYEAGKQLDALGTGSRVNEYVQQPQIDREEWFKQNGSTGASSPVIPGGDCANTIIVATARRLGIPGSLTGVMQTEELDVRERAVFHVWCDLNPHPPR